jgi:hypothetical protein
MLQGEAELFGARQAIDVHLSKKAFWFQSETRLFDLFTADLSAESVFDLRRPSFKVDAVVQNDFGEVLGPLFQDGLVQFAEGGAEVTAAAREAIEEVDRVLADAQATVEDLRRVIEARRARARAAVQEMQQRVAQARRALNSALASRNAAWRAYQNTPWRRAGLKAQRRAAYARANARFLTRAAVYNGRRAPLAARQAVLDALPPPDRNILVMTAEAAAQALRNQLRRSQERLQTLEARFLAIAEAAQSGETLVTIQRAEFHGELSAAAGGGAIRWDITGSFAGRPFEVHRELDFSNVGEAAAQIVEGLLRS